MERWAECCEYLNRITFIQVGQFGAINQPHVNGQMKNSLHLNEHSLSSLSERLIYHGIGSYKTDDKGRRYGTIRRVSVAPTTGLCRRDESVPNLKSLICNIVNDEIYESLKFEIKSEDYISDHINSRENDIEEFGKRRKNEVLHEMTTITEKQQPRFVNHITFKDCPSSKSPETCKTREFAKTECAPSILILCIFLAFLVLLFSLLHRWDKLSSLESNSTLRWKISQYVKRLEAVLDNYLLSVCPLGMSETNSTMCEALKKPCRTNVLHRSNVLPTTARITEKLVDESTTADNCRCTENKKVCNIFDEMHPDERDTTESNKHGDTDRKDKQQANTDHKGNNEEKQDADITRTVKDSEDESNIENPLNVKIIEAISGHVTLGNLKGIMGKTQELPIYHDDECSQPDKQLQGKEDVENLLLKLGQPLTNTEDIFADPRFKLKHTTCIVSHLGQSTTAVWGIPWCWFNEEKWRLQTFARYPYNAAKSGASLASNGFVYTGSGAQTDDSVLCYFCTVSKQGWRGEESIIQTHRNLNSACPMVTGAPCNNVPLLASTNSSTTRNYGFSEIALPQLHNEESGMNLAMDYDETDSPMQRLEAQPANGRSRPPQPREPFQMATITMMSAQVALQSSVDGAHCVVNSISSSNQCQPTDENVPSRLVTSLDTGLSRNTSTLEAHPSMQNSSPRNSIQQTEIQNNSDTLAPMLSTPANQLTMTGRSNQPLSTDQNDQSSTSNAPLNQGNNQQSAPNVPLNQGNNQQPPPNAPLNQGNNQQSPPNAPLNQNNNQTPPPNAPENQTNPPANPSNPTYYQLGIITERPKRFEYALRQRRLDSFREWPAGHHLKKEDLADAGFYYACYSDCARCFFCGGGLRNWEVGDDVWVEHARWFPKCAFVRQRVGQAFIDTVAHFARDHEMITFKMVVDEMNIDPATFQIDSKENHLKNDAAVKTVRDMGYSEADCYKAVTLNKENNQILSADELYETLQTNGAVRRADQKSFDFSIEPASDEQNDREKLQKCKQENNDLRMLYLCKICMDKEAAVVFLPCGHMACCTECAAAIRDCPVCRKQVKGVVRAFVA